MALYRNVSTGEIRDLNSALVAEWVAAGNPKAAVWEAYTPPPPPPPEPVPPAPDWAQMRQALQSENGFPAAWAAAFQANPLVAGMMGPRLDLCETNGRYDLFIDSLLIALATLNNQAQAADVAVEFVALAERCSMPAEFLEELDRRLLQTTP